MNKTIRLLAEQARTEPMGNSWTYRRQKDFEEAFAKIIIFECVKIAEFKRDSATGRAIKEHFGVDIMSKDEYIKFLEDRLKHQTEQTEKAMEMLAILVGKLKVIE